MKTIKTIVGIFAVIFSIQSLTAWSAQDSEKGKESPDIEIPKDIEGKRGSPECDID